MYTLNRSESHMSGTVVFPPNEHRDGNQRGEMGEIAINPTGLPLRSQLTPGERAYFDAIGLTEDVIRTIAVELQYGLGSSSRADGRADEATTGQTE
jgi:hypothetical protein